MAISKSVFGKTNSGHTVTQYKMTNRFGQSVEMIDYGAIITAINVLDRGGAYANVTLGLKSIDGYLELHPYLGATIGRYCNRIANGRFTLDGKNYQLSVNNGPNHLHGGVAGLDKQMWEAKELVGGNSIGLRFSQTSPDGEEGYPGNLQTIATYTWSDACELTIAFEATTDSPTHVNLTNHAYFNLAGAGSGLIYEHELQLPSNEYLAIDETMIPTGEIKSVTGTPFDFREFRKIGERIDELNSTLGYDHCFVVPGAPAELRRCATAIDRKSGRAMEVSTTQPGVQIYTGNFLSETKALTGFGNHEAFCVETQHYPDSPNQAAFPSTLLLPGQVMREETVYRFFIEP